MLKTVPVRLGGRERQLRLDFNALSQLEREMRKHYGAGLLKILNDMTDGDVNFDVLRMTIWYALRWKDQRLTIEDTGLMMQEALNADELGLADFVGVVLEVLQAAGVIRVGKPEQGEENDESGKALPESTS